MVNTGKRSFKQWNRKGEKCFGASDDHDHYINNISFFWGFDHDPLPKDSPKERISGQYRVFLYFFLFLWENNVVSQKIAFENCGERSKKG